MNFLFLQGLATPFMRVLALHLAHEGHNIHKLSFCGGDVLFWALGRRFPAGAMQQHLYRQRPEDLPAYYESFVAAHKIDAVVLFGDMRPVHAPVIALCKDKNIPVHVLEEGYARPNWITLDRGGANAGSALPRDPAYYLAQYGDEEKQHDIAQAIAVGGGFKRRISMDLALHIANLIGMPVFPHYRTHRPHIAGVEYAGFLGRILRHNLNAGRYKARFERLALGDEPFYLLPLQLDGDSQIRHHCAFKNGKEVIGAVVESFARHAPADALLGVKLHPLDNGLTDYERICREQAQKYGVESRVMFFSGGSLPDLLRKTQGVVTVNSTVGLSALIHGLRVKTLGRALYNIDGLVYAGGLDDFWQDDFKPDMHLLQAFRAGVIAQSQINGNFFTREGIELGARNAVQKINRIR